MANFFSNADAVGEFDPMLTAARDPSEQFLRLRLSAQIAALLPMQQLTEVLTVSETQIMPIPHLPAWAMGVHNWRGEILWMVDLGHLCGLSPWYEAARAQHAAVVLNLPEQPDINQRLGLVVQQIEEIESCMLQNIQPWPPATAPAQLKPFTAGYWQKSAQESLPVLDGAAIFQQVSLA